MKIRNLALGVAVSAFAAMSVSLPASATLVRITATNTSGPGGLSLTPLFFAFQDGSVDLFNVGAAAGNGLEQVAETGNFSPLESEVLAQQATAVTGAAFGTDIGAPGPIEPGETASFVVDLDAIANRFLVYAAMVLPSNDTFVGVDDSTAFALFDAAGDFLGPQTFDITGAFAYDAGTEVNDASLTGGAAFVQGVDITQGIVENGVVGSPASLSDFLGLTLANGTVLNGDIDFLSDPNNFSFARIEVSAVPLPPALVLMLAAVASLRLYGRSKQSA